GGPAPGDSGEGLGGDGGPRRDAGPAPLEHEPGAAAPFEVVEAELGPAAVAGGDGAGPVLEGVAAVVVDEAFAVDPEDRAVVAAEAQLPFPGLREGDDAAQREAGVVVLQPGAPGVVRVREMDVRLGGDEGGGGEVDPRHGLRLGDLPDPPGLEPAGEVGVLARLGDGDVVDPPALAGEGPGGVRREGDLGGVAGG